MLETWYVFVTEDILNNSENVNFRNFYFQKCSLSETAHSPSKHKDKHGFIISQCKHTEL